MSDFPAIPPALLQALEDRFPNRCPEANVPLDEVRALAGIQRVLAFLRARFEEQTENVLATQVLNDVSRS